MQGVLLKITVLFKITEWLSVGQAVMQGFL